MWSLHDTIQVSKQITGSHWIELLCKMFAPIPGVPGELRTFRRINKTWAGNNNHWHTRSVYTVGSIDIGRDLANQVPRRFWLHPRTKNEYSVLLRSKEEGGCGCCLRNCLLRLFPSPYPPCHCWILCNVYGSKFNNAATVYGRIWAVSRQARRRYFTRPAAFQSIMFYAVFQSPEGTINFRSFVQRLWEFTQGRSSQKEHINCFLYRQMIPVISYRYNILWAGVAPYLE